MIAGAQSYLDPGPERLFRGDRARLARRLLARVRQLGYEGQLQNPLSPVPHAPVS